MFRTVGLYGPEFCSYSISIYFEHNIDEGGSEAVKLDRVQLSRLVGIQPMGLGCSLWGCCLYACRLS